MNYHSQNANNDVIMPGQVATQNFGGQTLQQNHGTADTALAAQLKAQVEARYLMAMHRPRDIDQVRERLLRNCARPAFAQSAMYRIPRAGGFIEGLSIRFAETAVGCMTNVNCETITLYDDKIKRILRIQVTDVESNETFSRDITIEKSVERRKLGRNQEPISVRTNSYGDTVYSVQATEDELNTKESAIVSKTLRTLILRIVPGWLQDEAKDVLKRTSHNQDAKDPDAQKKRVLDAFASMNIGAAAIKDYLGREQLDPMSTDELTELRDLHSALREGHARWADVLDDRKAARRPVVDESTEQPALPEASRSKATLAKLQKKAAKADPAPVENKPKAEPEIVEGEEPWKQYLEEKPEGIDDGK